MSRIRVWSVHEIAQCRDCTFYSEDRNAVKKGGDHHRKTGHRVTGERGTAYCFDADSQYLPKEGAK